MPLQNRVDPFGRIEAVPERGTLMGNRGGCLHDDSQQLGRRRWVSKAWISCVLEFRGRRRQVMTPRRYTELFFLDEATALAAGHRPCFECRRRDAQSFASAWARGHGLAVPPRAGEMDDVLHRERIGPGNCHPTHKRRCRDLPAGTIIAVDGRPGLVFTGAVWPWSFKGYGPGRPLPSGEVEVITPPSVVLSLAAGYQARVHSSVS